MIHNGTLKVMDVNAFERRIICPFRKFRAQQRDVETVKLISQNHTTRSTEHFFLLKLEMSETSETYQG